MISRLELPGPLAPWAARFAQRQAERGYAALTVYEQLRVMAQLSQMLERDGLGPEALTSEVLDRFLAERRARGSRTYVSVRGLDPLMSFLRSVEVVPPAVAFVPTSPGELTVGRYRRFLAEERGLAPRSIMQCCLVAERLAGVGSGVGERDLERLETRDVGAFIDSEAAGLAPASVGHVLWSLRSFLKFLFLEGTVERPLADSVPAVRVYSASSLPDPVTAADAQALVGSCDTTTAIGRRDRAVLMLLSRLGLRAGEVARLGLDDIDWRNGEVTVRGKGGRVDRLPLPCDVGEAVALYLRHSRPGAAPTRAVFVGLNAPHGPLSSAGTMNRIVRNAADRAGLGAITPHRLRHGAASQMLATGATLVEIGQVLRHRHVATTAIYAKVDAGRLSVLARSWPAVSS